MLMSEESDELAEMRKAWEEVERVRKYRRRKYAIAAGFTALGVYLLFLSLAVLLLGISVAGIDPIWIFIALILTGSASFGYGFYRMGVS